MITTKLKSLNQNTPLLTTKPILITDVSAEEDEVHFHSRRRICSELGGESRTPFTSTISLLYFRPYLHVHY